MRSGKPFRVAGGGFLAVGLHQFLEGREQGGLGHAVAVEPVQAAFREGFRDVAQGGALRVLVGVELGLVGFEIGHRQP